MNRFCAAVFLFFLMTGASSCRLYDRFRKSPKPAPAADSTLAIIHRDSPVLLPDTLLVQRDTIAITQPDQDSLHKAALKAWGVLWERHTPFSTFSGKAKVHYEDSSESRDFAVAIRIVSDRQIWLSVTAFGGMLEVVRARITPDSLFIIDRFHREVRMMPLAEAGALLTLPANFDALQRVIMGEPLALGIPVQQAEEAADTTMVGGTSGKASQELRFSKADTLLRRQWLLSGTAALDMIYGDYKATGSRLFAHQRQLLFFKESRNAQSSIMLDYSKATFDEPVEMPFEIPQKYERK